MVRYECDSCHAISMSKRWTVKNAVATYYVHPISENSQSHLCLKCVIKLLQGVDEEAP